MKKLFILLLLAISFSSCNKNNIQGTWVWYETVLEERDASGNVNLRTPVSDILTSGGGSKLILDGGLVYVETTVQVEVGFYDSNEMTIGTGGANSVVWDIVSFTADKLVIQLKMSEETYNNGETSYFYGVNTYDRE